METHAQVVITIRRDSAINDRCNARLIDLHYIAYMLYDAQPYIHTKNIMTSKYLLPFESLSQLQKDIETSHPELYSIVYMCW